MPRVAEFKVEIRSSAALAVDDILLDLGVREWTVVEDVVARRAWIVGIFGSLAEARSQWEALRPLLPAPPVAKPGLRSLAESQWKDSYKAHFRAWRMGRFHWVPSWERKQFKRQPGHAVLWLDPGLAFGTGNHETTRLCCMRLVAWAERNAKEVRRARVIDAGCGSGILALSAARLGFGEVKGFDNDPEAVRVSRENSALNRLSNRVTFFTADIEKGLSRCGPADVVLANIQADVLASHARTFVKYVLPGGVLALSGLLGGQCDAVRGAFAAAAPEWRVRSRRMGEWRDLVFERVSARPNLT